MSNTLNAKWTLSNIIFLMTFSPSRKKIGYLCQIFRNCPWGVGGEAYLVCLYWQHQSEKEKDFLRWVPIIPPLYKGSKALCLRLWCLSQWSFETEMLRFNGNKIPLHLKRFLLDVRHLKHVYKHGKTNAPTSETVPLHSQVFFEFTMWVKSKHRTNTSDGALKMITASNREKGSFGFAGKRWLTWLSVQESLPFNECLERNPCLRCFIFVDSCLTRVDLSHL